MKKAIFAVAALVASAVPALAQSAGDPVIIRNPPGNGANVGTSGVGAPGPMYPERIPNLSNPSVYYGARTFRTPSGSYGGVRSPGVYRR